MAEWFKAAVLKTADRKVRGFESYSLRHQILFAEAVAYAQSLARQHEKLTWNGFRVYAIDGAKKNCTASGFLDTSFY